MSVLLKEDNIIIISHEDYIRKMYNNVNGESLCFNQDLFAICEPFKTYSTNTKSTKKRKQNDTNVQSFPAKTFEKYREKIVKCLVEHTQRVDKQIKQDMCDSNVFLANNTTECSKKRKFCDSDDKAYKVPNLIALNAVSRLQDKSSVILGNFNGSNTFSHAITKNINAVDFLFPANCTFICNDARKLSDYLKPEEKFDVIVMDPPWTNKAIRRKNKKQFTNGYSFMSNGDIEQLSVDSWLKQDGVVFVWCTNSPEHRKAVDRFFLKWNLINVTLWYWLKVTKPANQ
ncbi:DNA N6-methyl methyltransferase [Atheta coriaria]|uniref:DNA N6-methyl methyltransferase n=1 Tax=Dalotia coriaria TaxID=877792 RepID=UPI0031F464DC